MTIKCPFGPKITIAISNLIFLCLVKFSNGSFWPLVNVIFCVNVMDPWTVIPNHAFWPTTFLKKVSKG